MLAGRLPFVLFALSFCARLLFTDATTDDAFITYRYVENILAGNGFVYNVGERVLGVTTPLYTLLLALVGMMGVPARVAGPLLNILADSLVAPLLSRPEPGSRERPIFGPLLYALCPINAFWSASGMETGLFCFTIALALYLYERERLTAASIACAVAVLLRVDAGILVAVLIGHHLTTRRRMPWRAIAAFAGTVAPWIVFATIYFGQPVPNSVIAKAALQKTAVTDALWTILGRGFLHLRNPVGIALLGFAIYAFVAVRRSRSSPWTLFAITYAAAYTLTRAQLHPWYYPPAYVGYLPLAGVGIGAAIARIRLERWKPLAVILLAAGAAAGLGIVYRTQLKQAATLGGFLRRTGAAIGRATPAGSSILLKDIGYLGYYSGLQVHDFAGLVTPALIPYRARLDFAGGLRAVQSDYALVSPEVARLLEADEWFRANYELIEIYSSGEFRMLCYGRRSVRSGEIRIPPGTPIEIESGEVI
ncbi:MAG: hypothetical protein HYX75_04305 [Acidobacteria bacterium]|nr:hypothetical protein [Acidobacteriota bacterium]